MNFEAGVAVVDDNARGRFLRRKLRRASFISPSTGERSNREFTLRETSRRLNNSIRIDESTSLLQGANSNNDPQNPVERSLCFRDKPGQWLHQGWDLATSQTGRGILKCSLAYFLASLATFVPAIHSLIGQQQDSKHMVASVTVWFHPARTIGSMHEATVLAFIAICFSWFISFTSMAVSMFFAAKDMIEVGHVIVLIVFLGGGLGAIAWVKQRLNHPLVNVACAVASFGCITTFCKEGSLQAGEFSTVRVFQVFFMVAMGVVITTIVNGLVWPATARTSLAKDVVETTDLLGEMLVCTSRAFLSGREVDMQTTEYTQISDEHTASLSSTRKNLGEAKREWYALGRERLWSIEHELVECLVGLSHDLGGLRSAAYSQFAILEEVVTKNAITVPSFGNADSAVQSKAKHIAKPRDADGKVYPILGSISESPEAVESFQSPHDSQVQTELGELAHMQELKTPSDLFMTFLDQLGPPTKSLVYTLKQILDELPFTTSDSHSLSWISWIRAEPAVHMEVHKNFEPSLRQAIGLYRQSRAEALAALYRNRAISASLATRRSSIEASSHADTKVPTSWDFVADIEEVTACCGYFSFALLDFAEDIMQYLTVLDKLKAELDRPSFSWNWMFSWTMRRHSRNSSRLTRSSTFYHVDEEHEVAQGLTSPIERADAFADAGRQRLKQRWRRALYHGAHILDRDDVKFAIKVGIGAVLYALPAFLSSTRPFFVQWRGEWGLVSYMAICCMTIGASNTTSIKRIIGTIIGAAVAVLAWVTSSDNGTADSYILAFWGWLVSLVCYYLILAKNNGPMGRFILLTYNLGALYSYSLSIQDGDDDDDEGGIDPAIWDIVLHRVVAVIVGCIWGIIVTRLIWPVSARRKLQKGMCMLWLRMSLIWKRDPLAVFLLGAPRSKYMDIREEAALHSFLSGLDGLRKSAQAEFELRGPFPDAAVKRILDASGRMLDAFHAINIVINKNLQYTPGEAAVLRFTRSERFELSGRISHLFSVLASSIKLEYPVNDVLPSIDHTRDRLLARVAEFRRRGEGRELAIEQDYELIYAYVLVTGQLSKEIRAVASELEVLFGVLDEDNFKLD